MRFLSMGWQALVMNWTSFWLLSEPRCSDGRGVSFMSLSSTFSFLCCQGVIPNSIS